MEREAEGERSVFSVAQSSNINMAASPNYSVLYMNVRTRRSRYIGFELFKFQEGESSSP